MTGRVLLDVIVSPVYTAVGTAALWLPAVLVIAAVVVAVVLVRRHRRK